ncbi:MAG: glycosyltransferase family 4 protein [Acidimicrobiales bacterium]
MLPGVSRRPVGGFRVPYEYANRLARLGHDIVVHHELPEAGPLRNASVVLNRLPRSFVTRRTTWFDLDSSVRIRIGPPRAYRASRNPPDVYLLTSWRLALAVGTRYPPEKVVQLVHDYEFWADPDEARRGLMRTAFGHGAVRYVGTSSAVVEMLRECGTTPSAVIHAGIDRDVYADEGRDVERANRVGVLLRSSPHKGTDVALKAFALLRGEGVDFQTIGAGTTPGHRDVTFWPAPDDQSMRAFYNSLRVFVLPSRQEAWGLPALEAMACGAAVVLVDNVGCRDFAVDERNCLLVPPGRPDLLARSVERLLADDSLRRSLVLEGMRTVQRMDWDASVRALLGELERASVSRDP